MLYSTFYDHLVRVRFLLFQLVQAEQKWIVQNERSDLKSELKVNSETWEVVEEEVAAVASEKKLVCLIQLVVNLDLYHLFRY